MGPALLGKGPEHRIPLGSPHGAGDVERSFLLTSKPWVAGLSCVSTGRCACEQAPEEGSIACGLARLSSPR